MKVKVEYLLDHGNSKKGEKTEMFESTALALEKHKVLKVLKGKDKEA